MGLDRPILQEKGVYLRDYQVLVFGTKIANRSKRA